MKTRKIEMAVCWADGTWANAYFVNVPIDTLPEDLERRGRTKVMQRIDMDVAHVWMDVAHVWLYNSMNNETEDIPIRSSIQVILSFNKGQTTVGSEREQQISAIKQVNFTLQKKSFGLGARIEESS